MKLNIPWINIEKKFLTVNEGMLLGGITIDWRNDADWNSNRKRYERIVKKSLFNVYKKPPNLKLSTVIFTIIFKSFLYKITPLIRLSISTAPKLVKVMHMIVLFQSCSNQITIKEK